MEDEIIALKTALLPLEGDWQGLETISASKFNPKRSEQTAHYRFRLALGGTILISDYAQFKDDAVHFESHGVYRLDTSGDYVLVSFDSMGVAPDVFLGGLTDQKLVMVCTNDCNRWRLTQDFSEADQLRSVVEFWHAETHSWLLFSEGRYTRI